MDHLKKAIADTVTMFINDEQFADELFTKVGARPIESPMSVEVHDVTPLENMIRVTGIDGGPRYFIIQVRESQ